MRTLRTYVLTAWLVLVLALAQAWPQAQQVGLTLHPRGAPAGTRWPVTFGVPVPQGVLRNAEQVKLVGPEGREAACQVAVTARWLDDSVQWLLVDCIVDLPATPTAYRLLYGPTVQRQARPKTAVTVSKRSDEFHRDVVLDAGPVRAVVAGDSMGTLRKLVTPAGNLFQDGRGPDLWLIDEAGTDYLGSRDREPTLTVEESGPIRATVKLEGWTVSEKGEKLGKHVVRIQAFAGVPGLRVYHTWIVTADSDTVHYRNLSCRLPFRGTGCEFLDVKGAKADLDEKARLLQYDEKESDLVLAGRAAQAAGRCRGWVRVGDPGYGLYVKDFWQNFPKELEVAAGELRVHLWPAHGRLASHVDKALSVKDVGRLWFAHEGQVLDFAIPREVVDRFQYGGSEDNILLGRFSNAMGVAKTHEFWLDVSARGEGDPPYARCFQARAVMAVDPDCVVTSGAFGRIAARDDGIYKEIEEATERVLDWVVQMRDPVGDYGMWNYGDYHQTYMPALDSAHIHRHWVGFHHGGPRWPWITYVRTGDPRFLDFAETNARHVMDIDMCHYTTDAFNKGQIEKITRVVETLKSLPDDLKKTPNPEAASRVFRADVTKIRYPKRTMLKYWKTKHITKRVGATCQYKGLVHWFSGCYLNHNTMADWLLWCYCVTGYRRALDVAMELGSLLKQTSARYDKRAGMAIGDSNLTMYLATRDPVFEQKMHEQMGHFLDKGQEASCRHIYYSPFAERYHDLTGSRKLRDFIVAWADMRIAENRPWASRDTWHNLMAYAYQFTGDAKYLRYSLVQLRALLDSRQRSENPLIDGVVPAALPGGISYTAQQWPLALRALRDHEKKTGEAIPIPPSGVSPFRFRYATYVRWQDVPKGKTMSDMSKRMVFYLRKAADETVELPLRFRVSRPARLRVAGPNGKAIVEVELKAEVKGRRQTMEVEQVLRLGDAHPTGDYRIELTMPYGRYFDTVVPWEGRYTKLVADARPLARFDQGSRFYFMPRVPVGKQEGRFRLRFGVNPDRYYLVSRVWGPDGALRDVQCQPPKEALHKVTFTGEAAGKLWRHTRGFGPNAYAELSGDVVPVMSFTRESFFVPRALEGK